VRAALAAACLIVASTVAQAAPTEPYRVVVLQGLDKVTARVAKVLAQLGQETRFGSLAITPRACLVAPPIDPPEAAAYLEIKDVDTSRGGDGEQMVFQGWMMASTPGLSTLEHPVYDVWVIGCEEPEPAPPPAAGPSPTTSGAKP
jgi:hypothetical protein